VRNAVEKKLGKASQRKLRGSFRKSSGKLKSFQLPESFHLEKRARKALTEMEQNGKLWKVKPKKLFRNKSR
jgi:hypothetical protein